MAMAIEADTQPMTKKAKITFAVVGGLAFFLLVYGIYWWWSGRNFRALVAMTQEETNWDALSNEEKKGRFDQMKNLSKGLSRDQREQLDNIRETQMEKRDLGRLNNFFALNKKDQTAALDKEIKRGEEMRKQWEQKIQQFQKNGANKDKKGGAGGQNANRGAGGAGGAGAGGGQGGGRGGAGGGGGKSSPEQRNKSAANRLDRSSPEYRLAKDTYRQRLDERRQQLGLPPSSGRGPTLVGGGGRPGGGGGGGGKR
ncbi:MAG: hypothetical protein EXR99_06450 [Gemmataceae bacterium]|nr:hypothetical protein [Gemmataceae bacterium]